MRIAVSTATVISALLFAGVTHAEEQTWWDLRGQIPGKGGIEGLTNVQVQSDGVRVQTSNEGFLYWEDVDVRSADVLTLRVVSPRSTPSSLLWEPEGDTSGAWATHRFDIPPKSGVQDVHIPLPPNTNWNARTPRIAFAFPAGTDVTIQAVVWTQWSTLEKAAELWKSFWTMDTYRSYTINFIWGPILTTNPIARGAIWQSLPPKGLSATRYLYPLLGLAVIVGIGLFFTAADRTLGRRRMLRCIVGSFAAAWLLFDVRMGIEMLGYVRNDWERYVTKPMAERTLRTHGDFYAIAEQSIPTLMEKPTYGLLTQDGTPFYANMRYRTYPSLPKTPDMDTTGVRAWLVVERPDATVNANGQLSVDGVALSDSGSIIRRFSDDSFLFREQ